MNNLKAIRKRKNLSQEDIAKILNVKQNTISNWENEKTEIDKTSLNILADFFEVSVDYLLGRTNQPQAIEKALGIDQEQKDRLKNIPIAFYNKLGAKLDNVDLSPEGQQDILKYIDLVIYKEKNK